MPVHLEAERDLRIIEVIQPNVFPSEPAQLGDPSAGKSSDREQRPERLMGGLHRLLDLLRREDR